MCQLHIQIIMVQMVIHGTEHRMYEMVFCCTSCSYYHHHHHHHHHYHHHTAFIAKKKMDSKSMENYFCIQYC